MGYCERCGGRFDFDGCCERCGGDDEWTWNKPKNENEVICKGCGNEIYEVRRHCHICGKINPAAFKKGDYYCPCCGIALKNGSCPNCGKTLERLLSREIKPIDLRYCSKCKKEVSRNDKICLYCGNEHYINKPLKAEDLQPKKEKQKERNPKDHHCPGCGNYFDFDGFCWKCGIERFEVYCRKLKPEEITHCTRCKEEISIKDKFCPICGKEVHKSKSETPQPKEPVKNDKPVIHARIPDYYEEPHYTERYTYSDINTTLWLVLGIFSLVVCCMPTSIGTIYNAVAAKNMLDRDDVFAARRRINKAKIWFFIGAGINAALMIASVIIQVLG